MEHATLIKIADALENGDLGAFRKFWEDGVVDDINHRMLNGCTFLHELSAVEGETGAFASFLITCGADVDARNDDLETPLHWAALAGDIGRARVLLERGADPNARNIGGRTPMHEVRRGAVLAVRDGYDDELFKRVWDLLFEFGADPHIIDNGRRTPDRLARQMLEESSSSSLAFGYETWRDL